MKRAGKLGFGVVVFGVLLAARCAAGDPPPAELLPTPDGATWTFRMSGAAVTSADVVVRVGRAGPGAASFFGPGVESREVEGAVVLTRGGEDPGGLLVERDANELKLGIDPWGGFFAARWTIPVGVKDGATWTGHQLFPSCGFMSLPASFSAHAEKVTVPAGTFDALRIDGESTWGGESVCESVWLVRGLGIVKLKTLDESWELVSSSLAPSKKK